MNNLPIEIFYDIFYHLDRPNIKTCCFVCKRWNLFAVQAYNKELTIDYRKAELAKTNLASDNADVFFKNGHHVRKLIFETGFEHKTGYFIWPTRVVNNQSPFIFSREEFLLLLKYFPNIEEINLAEVSYFTHYIYFLSFVNLQHVKKIAALKFDSQYGGLGSKYHEYFSTCFKFCGTLTSLYLEYTENNKNYRFGGVGILDMLKQFKNLKQIEFYNSSSDDMIMFRILELNPQLTEFNFTSAYSRSLRTIHESLEQRVNPFEKLNKRLQRLNISIRSLSIDFTKCLTSYIEDGLHTINIRVTHCGLYDWIEEVGMDDALKLMKKLGQLNNVSIIFFQTYNSITNRLSGRLKTTKWLQVTNAFKGSKNVICSVKFCGSRSLQDYFEYNWRSKQLTLYRGTKEAYDLVEQNEFSLPNTPISNIEHGIINRLEFDLGDPRENVISELLKYVLSNCINLQYFKVVGYLEIGECSSQINGALDSIQNSSKTIRFLCDTPTTEILDATSPYLPNIEVLIFACRSRNSLIFNLTGFKKLKQCYFISQDTSHYSRKPSFIKFEYVDRSDQSYYYENGGLVREEKRNNYLCQSFTFISKRDTTFTICFDSNKKHLNFDIYKIQETRFSIPTYPL